MRPDDVAEKATAYLRMTDRVLPGGVTGFYVVGSAALGEYVPGRSDLDFVALLRDDVTPADVRRLRALHLLAGSQAVVRAARRRERLTAGTPNGLFIRRGDVQRPVSQITAVASHTGYRFSPGSAFDLNPVVWKVLAERGLAFRGPEPGQLGLDWQPELLREWNLTNLCGYWKPWAARALDGRLTTLASQRLRYGHAWMVAWGVLGAPRLHCTIATGDVIGKRSAGEYALRVFGTEWRPVIEQGLAWWHGRRPGASRDDVSRAGGFVSAVVESAEALMA